jgi:hypothetical protein
VKVKERITSTSYEVEHSELRHTFLLQKINDGENIQQWIELPTHSNIVTAFAQDEMTYWKPGTGSELR